eukprot:1158396-Pelagomonas_calceolata.AAC.24
MPGSARGWNPTPRGPPPPPRPKYDASKREQEILAAALSGKSPDKKSASDALGEGSPERGQAPCDGGEGLLQQQQQQQQQLQKKKTEEAPSMHHGGSIKTLWHAPSCAVLRALAVLQAPSCAMLCCAMLLCGGPCHGLPVTLRYMQLTNIGLQEQFEAMSLAWSNLQLLGA